MTTTTVIDYVLGRLHDIGVTDIFGVPGDFAFPVQDAIVAHPDINWIGSCNELNAAYAADGYARIRGVGAVSTTYGVGELSAISAVAGSYAEHLPVFHLTGMPNLATQADRAGPPHPGQRGVRTVPQDGRHRRRRQRDHHPGQRRVRESTPCSASPETGLCRIEHERIAVRCSPGKDWPSTDRTDPR